MATIQLADYQQKMAQRYDKNVRTREFKVGDLVLRRTVGNAKDLNTRELASNWEGLYKVTAIARAGAY